MNDDAHESRDERAAEDAELPAPSEGRGAPSWSRLARLLAPPLLAAAAVGMHFWLNVPSPQVRRSLAEQAEQRAKPKPKPERPKPKPRPTTNSAEPRTDAELARLLKKFDRVDFDEEPVESTWARRHQGLVNKAVVVARKQAFEGAPEEPRVIVTGTRCRTIRCRFVLRSPYAHELELLDQALSRLEDEDGPLWRAYASERIEPPQGAPETDTYLQVTVAFVSDEPEGRTFVVGAQDDDAEDDPED